MLKRLGSLLGGSNDGSIKELRSTVEDINDLENSLERLSDEQLREKTSELKGRVSDGEELDDLLPQAFALVREASKRTLGERHFDVQLMGGIVLHQGKISEMKTGEGKTLVATLPSYLNALAGRGVHVVTVNDYLARRDAQWMGAVYDRLGLSIATLQHDAAYLYDRGKEGGEPGLDRLRSVERREAYLADITYGTNNEFGFDYLRDNMVVDLSQRVQRELHYGIVDEVDNILIDEARTPLIISGPAEHSPKEYVTFARLVPDLRIEQDYTIEEKHRSVSLTTEGIAKLEKKLGVKNLYDPSNYGQVHFVENALKAQAIYQRDREYVVRAGEVVIVDEFTGRLMEGRRYSDGIHQAIEAKEGVQIKRETITYATITLQNYFRLYGKLSGMTGTAATEGEEFWKIYKLDVVEIPTNKPMVRADSGNLVYPDQKAKYRAVVSEVEERSRKGQPVLLGTTDIDKSELISKMLQGRGVQHEVLNAKQHEREASIVAQAGRPGAVTVATNMAGRGTDIVLGGKQDDTIAQEEWQKLHDRVVELGGLHIIGTEVHEARRIENQLRGRAGRQGDPGSSRFYVALDDDLMRRFGGERIQALMSWAGMDDDTPLDNKMVSKSISSAQVKVEAQHFDTRKHLVEYDDVVNTHRDVIYGEREKILAGADLKSNVHEMVEVEVQEILDRYLADRSPENWDTEAVLRDVNSMFPPPEELLDPDQLALMAREEIEEHLLAQASLVYDRREAEMEPEVMRQVERALMLRVVDHNWVQHLTAMEHLRQGIQLQAFGQRDPLVMYKKDGHEKFRDLQKRIRSDVVHTIYHLGVTPESNGRRTGSRASLRGSEASVMTKVGRPRSRTPVTHGERKIGRNEPCPCESGKKYKRCHGA